MEVPFTPLSTSLEAALENSKLPPSETLFIELALTGREICIPMPQDFAEAVQRSEKVPLNDKTKEGIGEIANGRQRFDSKLGAEICRKVLERVDSTGIAVSRDIEYAYYDRLHPTTTLIEFMLISTRAAQAVDGAKVEKAGLKKPALNTNALIARINDVVAHRVAAAMGPRLADAVPVVANTYRAELSEAYKKDQGQISEDKLWLMDKVLKAVLTLNDAHSFYCALMSTERSGELDTSFLREYSSDLVATILQQSSYGIKSAVGEVELGSLPFKEVMITSPQEYLDIAHPTSRGLPSGIKVLASAFFTSGRFKSSKAHVKSEYTASGRIGMIVFEPQIEYDEEIEQTSDGLFVLLGSDGELYNSRGMSLKNAAQNVDGENEYEQLRAEVITKVFDLTVPLDVDDDAGKSDESDAGLNTAASNHKQTGGNGEIDWSVLRVRRIKQRRADSGDVNVDDSTSRQIVFRNVVWHYRALPLGYRATQQARINHMLALEEAGLAEREIPEGFTFVKSYELGDRSRQNPGTRVRHRKLKR